MAKVNLVSRYFNTKNQGTGRVSQDLKNYLSKYYEIKTTQCWSKRNIDYFYYNVFFRFFTLKNSDVYVACTSMETFFLPPKKSIVVVHDLIPILHTLKCATHYNTSPHNVIGAWAFFYLTLMKSKKFSKIICISEETRKDYLQITKCDASRVIVIDNWIQKKYNYKKPIKLKNKIIIGTLSVVDSRKRSDILVKEFMKIKDDNLELHIGGSGSILEELKIIAKYDKRIKFFGHIPEKKMVNFYTDLDVFIFPSSQEGFGIPIIEAMAIGRPVITIKNSNIPKKVTKNTIKINWGNLHKTIYDCQNIPEKKNKELSKWATSEFNIDKQIIKYVDVIEEVKNG